MCFRRFINEYERVLNSSEVKQKMSEFKDMMNDLTKLTGKKFETLIDIFGLYHTLAAESSMGLPLPEWAYNYFPYGKLLDGVVAFYNTYSHNTLLKRLLAGKIYHVLFNQRCDEFCPL